MEIEIRKPLIGEEDALGYIWKTVFDDGDESAFFNYYYNPELSIIAAHSGIPVSTGYLLPAGNLICGDLTVPCAMIYGVATLPEYRKLGFGTAVVRKLILTAHSAGFPAIVLCPSTNSLFEYYSSRTDFRDWFYIMERKFKKIPQTSTADRLVEVLPNDYNNARKKLLANIPHIEPDMRALSYQSALCQELGGGLFQTDTPGGISCAIVERQRDGALWIKEVLAPVGYEGNMLAAIASVFPAEEYIVRTPAGRFNSQFTTHYPKFTIQNSEFRIPNSEFPNSVIGQFCSWDCESVVRRFGMLTASDAMLQALLAYNVFPWFGLAFD